MAIDLKASKPRMMTSVWDVINVINDIRTEDFDVSAGNYTDDVRKSNQIENEIVKAGATIEGYLSGVYSVAELRTDPWTTPPVPDKDNTGDLKLYGISPGTDISSAYTAAWTIELTSSTEYTTITSLEAGQGAGAIATDYTADNFNIGIGSNAWEVGNGTDVATDKWYFSVIDVYPIIWDIATGLAVANVLESIFTSESPNANGLIDNYRRFALSKLRKLQKPDEDDGMVLDSYTRESLESTPVDYNVTFTGVDNSSYSEEPPTRDGVGSTF